MKVFELLNKAADEWLNKTFKTECFPVGKKATIKFMKRAYLAGELRIIDANILDMQCCLTSRKARSKKVTK